MRKIFVAAGAALLFWTGPGAQAQSRVQSQLGKPVQFVEMTQDMRNFLNRYAKAATGKPCRTFDTSLRLGGMVLADPGISSLKVEELFRELDQEILSHRDQYGRDAKVFMDQPRNVVIAVTNEAGTGPVMSLVQIRGQRMLLTACLV